MINQVFKCFSLTFSNPVKGFNRAPWKSIYISIGFFSPHVKLTAEIVGRIMFWDNTSDEEDSVVFLISKLPCRLSKNKCASIMSLANLGSCPFTDLNSK